LLAYGENLIERVQETGWDVYSACILGFASGFGSIESAQGSDNTKGWVR